MFCEVVADAGFDGEDGKRVVDDKGEKDIEGDGEVIERVWGEDVKEKGDEDLSDDDIERFLEEDVVFSVVSLVRDSGEQDLEGVVGMENVGVARDDRWKDADNKNFYRVSEGVGELYDSDMYDEKAGSGEEDYGLDDRSEIRNFGEIEEDRRGGRSILEIAGFRDEEAEKKREKSRFPRW